MLTILSMPRGPRLVRIASATALAASIFVVRTSFFLAFSLHNTTTFLAGSAESGAKEQQTYCWKSCSFQGQQCGDCTHLKVSPFAFRPPADAAAIKKDCSAGLLVGADHAC